MIKVEIKELVENKSIREALQIWNFPNGFMDAFSNTLENFVKACRSHPFIHREYDINIQFDVNKDSLTSVFEYAPFAFGRKKYFFSCHGHSFSFNHRKKMFDFIEDVFVKFGVIF